MPKVTRSPPLNKSHSMSESDVAKATVDPSILDESNVTQRDGKRRRISDSETAYERPDIRTIIREELREVLGALQAQQNMRLDSLEKQISKISNQNATTHKNNLEIEKSINFLSDKLDDIQSTISRLEEDRNILSGQISKIDDKCDAIERNSRKTSIQIRNVPKQQGETKEKLFSMVLKLSASIAVSMEKSELRDVFRVSSKPGQATSTIIAEFSSTLTKGNFLTASKKHISSAMKYKTEQLNSAHLGLDGPKTEIYISEHLTPSVSRLYFLAREFRKTMGYEFCWTSNGLVYLRKKQGDPHILVKSEVQLHQLRNK